MSQAADFSIPISTSMPISMLSDLDVQCHKENKSRALFIREALSEKLYKNQKNNSNN